MPQIWPMNWIILFLLFTLTFLLFLTFIYFFSISSKIGQAQEMHPDQFNSLDWKW